jgi:GDP-L-fucose synthase
MTDAVAGKSTYWDGRRVTVTGGAGFLGRQVVQRLESLGASVFTPRSSEYDLTVENAARSMIADADPELIIHLAATVGGIGANQVNPGYFFYANMAMGMNVIEQARVSGSVKKIVLAGTTCSYPKFTPVPFSEDDLWNGYPEETNAPYGIAKRGLIAMGMAYRQQYGLNTVSLLPANLYGPGDNFDLESSHVIPALVRKFIEAGERGEKVTLWGTGSASREFLFVRDAADAFVATAEKYDGAEPINIGTGQEIAIKDLAEVIGAETGFTGQTVWDESRPDGQPRRCLDTSRARELFGFEATTDLNEGIRQTVDWFKAHSHEF